MPSFIRRPILFLSCFQNMNASSDRVAYTLILALNIALPRVVCGQTGTAPAPDARPTGTFKKAIPVSDLPPLPPREVILGEPKNKPAPAAPKSPKPETPSPITKIDRNATPPPEVIEKAKVTPLAKPALAIKTGTLGLPRLDAPSAVGMGAAKLAAGKFEMDSLDVPAGAKGLRKGQQRDVTYVALDPFAEWSKPLRGNPHDVTFVSLNMHASIATVIEAGGAWVSVMQSDKAGRAALIVGKPQTNGELKWDKAGLEVALETFGGVEMATLPILTLRIDSAAGQWDLYSGTRLVAQGLSLANDSKKGAARQVLIRAGATGVWLNAIALSDENPLFADENNNGIDDSFELSKRGALLSTKASAADKKALIAEWQKAQFAKPVPTIAVRPLPDRLVAKLPSLGQ
jgi:hypothetical protein